MISTYLEAAERLAGDVLASSGAPLSDAHTKAIADIAAAIAPEEVATADRTLDAMDALLIKLPDREYRERFGGRCASDAACDRWVPELTAGYYLGMAIGMRLSLNSDNAAIDEARHAQTR